MHVKNLLYLHLEKNNCSTTKVDVIWKYIILTYSDKDNREVKHDVYGKRQTAKMKLQPSVFSSLYSRIKVFVFAVNSETLFYCCVIYLRITTKEEKVRDNLCRLPSAVNVMLKLSNRTEAKRYIHIFLPSGAFK